MKLVKSTLSVNARNPIVAVNTSNLDHAIVKFDITATKVNEITTIPVLVRLMREKNGQYEEIFHRTARVVFTGINVTQNISVRFTKTDLNLPARGRKYIADISIRGVIDGDLAIHVITNEQTVAIGAINPVTA